jgi:hypothetical protein
LRSTVHDQRHRSGRPSPLGLTLITVSIHAIFPPRSILENFIRIMDSVIKLYTDSVLKLDTDSAVKLNTDSVLKFDGSNETFVVHSYADLYHNSPSPCRASNGSLDILEEFGRNLSRLKPDLENMVEFGGTKVYPPQQLSV